jgi:NAD-dependent DNA ligase
MLTAEKIMPLINELPEKEFKKLKKWFFEKDWAQWDKQIEEDSNNGKLDFLIEEALDGRAKGTLKEL